MSTNAPGLTLDLIEAALKDGQLFWWRGGDRFYRCRRNGATKRWVRRPNEWRIPCRAMFNKYPQLTHDSTIRYHSGPWSEARAMMLTTTHSPYGDSFIICTD